MSEEVGGLSRGYKSKAQVGLVDMEKVRGLHPAEQGDVDEALYRLEKAGVIEYQESEHFRAGMEAAYLWIGGPESKPPALPFPKGDPRVTEWQRGFDSVLDNQEESLENEP